MSLITSKSLTLAYEGRPVATDITFEVQAGDYLCIVGENGSGKSTLIKAILGLHHVTEGELTVNPETRAAGIGYLPQQTPAQKDFPASVQEIVRSGCIHRVGMRPFFRKSDHKLADEAMARMGITHLASRCYRELSGGQQQRVLLARAYCATGQLILLDEPIAGLDPLAMHEMYNLIAELNASGVAVVMVSHDVQSAVLYASHILHIGETNFFGRTEEYLKTPLGRKFGCERQTFLAADAPEAEDILRARPEETEGTRPHSADAVNKPYDASFKGFTIAPIDRAAADESAAEPADHESTQADDGRTGGDHA